MSDDKTVPDPMSPFGSSGGPTPAASPTDFGRPPSTPPDAAIPFVGTPGSPPTASAKPSTFQEIREILGDFVKRNEKVMWWLHTAYALGLGAFVATFAQKGFERARLLALSLAVVWLLVVFFFRFFGTGAQQDFITAWPGARRRFFVMSYLMKNLFQSMLFFQLPFYWKSSSYAAGTAGVLVGLATCAVLSTLDLVFDRVLLRFKLVASLFFALTLFGSANLVIPALFPNTPIILTLLVAGALSLATLVLFHVSLYTLRRPAALAGFAAFLAAGTTLLYAGRRAIPPVPVHLVEAGVGTALRADGKLESEVLVLRKTALPPSSAGGTEGALYAVAEVAVVGEREQFLHVWRRGDEVLAHEPADAVPSDQRGQVRVASRVPMRALPEDVVGKYTVDVVTTSDQIVGRVRFEIRE
jgi:hypothetical protein